MYKKCRSRVVLVGAGNTCETLVCACTSTQNQANVTRGVHWCVYSCGSMHFDTMYMGVSTAVTLWSIIPGAYVLTTPACQNITAHSAVQFSMQFLEQLC